MLVISCSDSRVDPETIFSAMPGELFVVRIVCLGLLMLCLIYGCAETSTALETTQLLRFSEASKPLEGEPQCLIGRLTRSPAIEKINERVLLIL